MQMMLANNFYVDEGYMPRFHHIMSKRYNRNVENVILGSSITYGVVTESAVTYSFPGAKVEHLYSVPNNIKQEYPNASRIIIYLGSNNFLGDRQGKSLPESPDQVIPKLKKLVRICQQQGFIVKLCPLIGLQGKKEICIEYNKLLRGVAGEMQLEVCSIRGANYKRDIGDKNPKTGRDGVHPTVAGINKIVACFKF